MSHWDTSRTGCVTTSPRPRRWSQCGKPPAAERLLKKFASGLLYDRIDMVTASSQVRLTWDLCRQHRSTHRSAGRHVRTTVCCPAPYLMVGGWLLPKHLRRAKKQWSTNKLLYVPLWYNDHFTVLRASRRTVEDSAAPFHVEMRRCLESSTPIPEHGTCHPPSTSSAACSRRPSGCRLGCNVRP